MNRNKWKRILWKELNKLTKWKWDLLHKWLIDIDGEFVRDIDAAKEDIVNFYIDCMNAGSYKKPKSKKGFRQWLETIVATS